MLLGFSLEESGCCIELEKASDGRDSKDLQESWKKEKTPDTNYADWY